MTDAERARAATNARRLLDQTELLEVMQIGFIGQRSRVAARDVLELVDTLQRTGPRAGINVPRLALSVAEAAGALGVSPDFFAEHIASELRFVRRGRKKLVAVRELERWLEEHAARVLGDAA